MRRSLRLFSSCSSSSVMGIGVLILVLFPGHLDQVRRRIVLHLYAWIEMILARGHDRGLTDTLPATECGQRRIRQFRTAADEFLMDSHEIPLAGREKIQDQLPVRVRLSLAGGF